MVAGGAADAPTYRNMGDHTESFQLVYDPEVISFEDILEVFWGEHDPYRQTWSAQYQNIAFFETDTQREAIERYVSILEKGGRKVRTRIEPLGSYTLAEDYHQKHSLRRFPEFTEALEKRSEGQGWMFTHEATKLNGYLGNYGSCDSLEKEVRVFGLPGGLEDELLGIVCSREGRKGVACPLPSRK